MGQKFSIDPYRIEYSTQTNWEGIKKIGFFIDNLSHGYTQSYYKNGNPQTEGVYYYNLLDGPNIRTYWENGEVKFVGGCSYGEPNGFCSIYRAGGGLASEGYY
jgi:antitoxin component YwqK of YwqJK toxin-antitoxin module